MPNIVLIQAHPVPDSFGQALGRAYAEGAERHGAPVQVVDLGRLRFDPILRAGFSGTQALEPDLLAAREAIDSAEHVALQFPVWWGNLPALLKGFIDRVFLPGWAFDHVRGNSLPKPLLAGRTARVLSTMDSPWWWYRLKHGRAAHRALTQATLHYVGITDVEETTVYALRTQTAQQRATWLSRAHDAGRRDAVRLSRRHERARVAAL